jgi:hypothetical protein
MTLNMLYELDEVRLQRGWRSNAPVAPLNDMRLLHG